MKNVFNFHPLFHLSTRVDTSSIRQNNPSKFKTMANVEIPSPLSKTTQTWRPRMFRHPLKLREAISLPLHPRLDGTSRNSLTTSPLLRSRLVPAVVVPSPTPFLVVQVNIGVPYCRGTEVSIDCFRRHANHVR